MSRVVVAVAAFVAGLVPAIAVAQVDPPAPTPIVTGCVIRLYDTGPEIHDDAWHDCTGADTVGLDAQGDLYITSSHATPVVSVTAAVDERSEEHTSELQSRENLVCRLLLEKKK